MFKYRYDDCLDKIIEAIFLLTGQRLGERKVANESDKVHLDHTTNELRAISDEAEELRETVAEEKANRLQLEQMVYQLESGMRLKNQEIEKLTTKLEHHEDNLRAAVALHEKTLRDEFSLDRARLKQENDHLEAALRTERNNHLITTRALEQMQLHYGCGTVPNEEKLEFKTVPLE